MPTSGGETGRAKRLAPQPPRTYELPGGPYTRDLGEVEVAVLAEIERGGDGDQGYGQER